MARTVAVVAGIAMLAPASAAAVELQPIGTYDVPVHVAADPRDPNRLFVVEQDGRIQRTAGGATTNFLDISGIVRSPDDPGGGGEQGLLSMAFAPNFVTSGHFYVFYTGHDDPGTGADESGSLHIAEFDVDAGGPLESTRREVIEIPHPGAAQNHNAGQLQFGPGGFLYASTGDGGTGGANAQDPNSLLGKIIRIDPSGSGPGQYSIPGDESVRRDRQCR